jgi:ATP-dependent helicase HepA
MTGLASSRIRLFPHQVEIASRVERDSIQRYLLADEVGLGKTIEAGVILRQYLLDHPDSTACIIVPPLLIPQWRDELVAKFGIDRLGAARVRFVAQGERGWWKRGPGLLIVDEAHHIASGHNSPDPDAQTSYAELCRAARGTERTLLLSATPLLHNEHTFLAMLHLLDPALYPLDGIAEFKARVESRREFALRFQAFVPGAPDYVLEEHMDAFRDLLPDDSVLAGQLDALEAAIEEEDLCGQEEAVRTARVHLGETYRLHQRVLRTRRGSPLAREFPVRGRRRPECLVTTWSRDESLDDWLSAWLDLVSARLATGSDLDAVVSAVVGLLDRWCAAPTVLQSYAQAWLNPEQAPPPKADMTTSERSALSMWPLSSDETQLLRDLCSVLERASFEDRWLSKAIDHILSAPEQTVVFCSHTATAITLADELDRRLPRRSVARYNNEHASLDAVEHSLDEFRRGVRRYLVCDRAGEEGRNFQFATAALHVDLPWNPSRLEQRIGRLDRYGERGQVPSLVLVSEEGVDAAWLDLLVHGYGLFDESIATLQHVLDKTITDAVRNLIAEGTGGVRRMAAKVRESLEMERREILQLENLESIEGEHVFGRGLFDSIQASEAAEADLDSATHSWLCGTRAYPNSIGLKSRLDTDRASVHHYIADNDPLNMPRESVMKYVGHFLGRNNRYTFRRETACTTTDVALVRPGEAILDSVEDLTHAEDLGQTYAFWRRHPLSDDPQLFAIFTFRIEADADRAASLLSDKRMGSDRREAIERTIDSFFSPQGLTVWLSSDGMPVADDDSVLRKLRAPFNWRSDKPLVSSSIPNLERLFDIDWSEWWLRQAAIAEKEAQTQAGLLRRIQDATRRVGEAYSNARNQLSLRSRLEVDRLHRSRLDEDIDISRQLEQAVIAAIDSAVATPEAVGVILLGRETPNDLFRKRR